MALPLTYHWHNLFVRKTATLATVAVLAAVVGVFAWMLSFAAAMERSLSVACDPGKIIVLKRGATAESNSAIPPDEFNRLKQLTDLAVDPKTGEPLISPEMMVQVSLPRIRDAGDSFANVAVRGVTPVAFDVHRNVRLLGPRFSEGVPEVIVGIKTAEQFKGLNMGDLVQLGYGGDRGYKVVGTFTADGGPMESEIWGYLPTLMNAYNRTMYSAASLRIREGANAKQIVEQIDGPAIQLQGKTETDYWQEQSSLIRTYLKIVRILVAMMSLAAVFAIANTMFSAVAGRTREIAMLKTIGFPKGKILSGFVLEAVMLSFIGGALGCLTCVAWLQLLGTTKDMYGASTFTTLAFDIRVTPMTMVIAISAVCAVGVVGAIIPAVRAARLGVVSALRAS